MLTLRHWKKGFLMGHFLGLDGISVTSFVLSGLEKNSFSIAKK